MTKNKIKITKTKEDLKALSEQELYGKALKLENSINFFLRKDEKIGPYTRVWFMWEEANRMWLELSSRSRASLTPKVA